MASTEIKAGDLTAVIGDNGAAGEHRAGYNGIWSLRHKAWPRTPFVPAYAGLNLEHIFDGATEFAAGNFFEPRTSPMRLHRRRPRSIPAHHMSRIGLPVHPSHVRSGQGVHDAREVVLQAEMHEGAGHRGLLLLHELRGRDRMGGARADASVRSIMRIACLARPVAAQGHRYNLTGAMGAFARLARSPRNARPQEQT